MTRQGVPARGRPGKRKPGERRGSVRFAPAQEIICYWRSVGGDYARARVCDIYAGGVCLLLRARVQPGTELAVELINGPHTFLCARTVRVARVYQGSGSDSVIGGEFDQKLGYDELLPFIL